MERLGIRVEDPSRRGREPLSRFVTPSIPDINTLRRVISHPTLRTLTSLALAGIVAVTAITSSGTESSVQAEGQIPPNSPQTNAVSLPDNPVYLVYGGEEQMWDRFNGEWGTPPNDSDRAVGGYYIYARNNPQVAWKYRKSFQLNQAFYSETTQGSHISLAIFGAAFDIANNRWYVISGVTDGNPDIYHPKGGEMGTDIAYPEDLSKRQSITSEGLPLVTTADSFESYRRAVDINGAYLEAGVKNASSSPLNGKYQLRLVSGNPVGIWKRIYRSFLSIVNKDFPFSN